LGLRPKPRQGACSLHPIKRGPGNWFPGGVRGRAPRVQFFDISL
jgi:hypothetical protein